jgi:hypothetical protein
VFETRLKVSTLTHFIAVNILNILSTRSKALKNALQRKNTHSILSYAMRIFPKNIVFIFLVLNIFTVKLISYKLEI